MSRKRSKVSLTKRGESSKDYLENPGGRKPPTQDCSGRHGSPPANPKFSLSGPNPRPHRAKASHAQ
jgi:hypothetical protein